MSRIDEAFAKVKSEGRAAFMPYVVAGDPDLDTTRKIILGMEKAGASLIELGVPFSDPMADGPTNQRAAERALKGGTTLKNILAMVSELRKESQIPVMLMGYYNSFYRYGLENFFKEAAAAGADGVIIPDLQPDDAREVREFADAAGVATVFLIAPTSTPERLELVAKESRGFVYAVSLTGVTGARDSLPPELAGFIAKARETISLPIAVGFGIGDAKSAGEVAQIADGVIVGSAIVRRVEDAVKEGGDPVQRVAEFVAELSGALAKS